MGGWEDEGEIKYNNVSSTLASSCASIHPLALNEAFRYLQLTCTLVVLADKELVVQKFVNTWQDCCPSFKRRTVSLQILKWSSSFSKNF